MRDEEEDDEDENTVKDKTEENSKMKEKMDQLRINMEKISLTKKVKVISLFDYFLIINQPKLKCGRGLCPLLDHRLKEES